VKLGVLEELSVSLFKELFLSSASSLIFLLTNFFPPFSLIFLFFQLND